MIDMLSGILIGIINFYRTQISSLVPPSCRFNPSCSEYAIEAIKLHGAFKGSRLALRRILRCHPYHPGGYDPVPISGRTVGEMKS